MVRLADIGEIVTGTTPSTSNLEYYSSKDIPFYKPGDLSDSEVRSLCIAQEFLSTCAKHVIRVLPKGSVLVSCIGIIGKIGITTNTCTCNQQINAIIPDENLVNNRYLAYAIISQKDRIRAIANAPIVPIINKTRFSNIRIPLVPLDMQKSNVEILDTVSELLSLRKQQLAELDHLIRSIFYNMFGEPITNSKNWKVVRLQDVCDVRDGTHDSPQYVQNGYPLITSKNIVNGSISFDNVNYITKEDFDQINKRSKVDVGDIIMPMIGTIGNPAIVKTDVEFAIKNVALIKFTTNKIINTYLKMLLSSSFFDIKTKEKSRGGTQKFIALGDIRNLNIPLPPISLQVEFDGFVKQIEEQKELVRRAIKETQLLFDSLMSQYFDE